MYTYLLGKSTLRKPNSVKGIVARASAIFLFNHEKYYISTTTIPMGTKYCRVLTYHDEFQPIKWHDSLIRWSFETMWQTKDIIFPLSECLYPPNLTGLLLTLMDSCPESHETLITWFWKVTWQTNTIRSPLQRFLWPLNPNKAGLDEGSFFIQLLISLFKQDWK